MPLEDRPFLLASKLDEPFRIFEISDRTALHAPRVAIVGTFAPRKCGIATFTTDVVEQVGRYHPEVTFDVYALDDPRAPHDYANRAEALPFDDKAAYTRAARAINDSGADAVWLQHEYGIFGGPDGEMVCDFVDRLAAPLVLTLHTVLLEPSERQRAILNHLIARASRIMVMSQHSKTLLAENYGAPRELVQVIEHGAPDRPFGREAEFKAELDLDDRPVLMTFGLLGPGKGLEQVIDALPAVLERHPRAIYRIVGATHPNLVAEQGEAYRESLVEQARRLGVDHAIAWENRFLDTAELLDQLEACDIYVTPYHNLQQSTSGTLSYAVALGKAVVSTPYIHATELLADGVGVLIEPGSSAAIADAVNGLLDDPAKLAATKRRAWNRGRETIWPRFAAASKGLVTAVVRDSVPPASLEHRPSFEGVEAMCDATGMLQHAIGIVPDRAHGYCTDDNARALMLVNVAPGLAAPYRRKRALVHASFLQDAWNGDEQAFRNFMRFDRQWCEDRGSDDSNGRALWALGQTVECAPDADLRDWARGLYDRVLLPVAALGSPRTKAFAMLGAAARLRRDPDHGISRDVLEGGADALLHELSEARSAGWAWFETRLGYDNARLPQALIEAGTALGRKDARLAGLETLGWLCERQTGAGEQFRPIGSTTFGRDHEALPFDQQPLEAQATIDAAHAAFRATQDERWLRHALAAWGWFFGENDRGVVLADPATGRCRDGINPRGANANCGAESILAFHLAHHSMIAMRQDRLDSMGEHLEPRSRLPANPLPHIR